MKASSPGPAMPCRSLLVIWPLLPSAGCRPCARHRYRHTSCTHDGCARSDRESIPPASSHRNQSPGAGGRRRDTPAVGHSVRRRACLQGGFRSLQDGAGPCAAEPVAALVVARNEAERRPGGAVCGPNSSAELNSNCGSSAAAGLRAGHTTASCSHPGSTCKRRFPMCRSSRSRNSAATMAFGGTFHTGDP
jgi:hypothetical protein